MKKSLLSLMIIFGVFGCVLKAEAAKVTTDRPTFYFNLGAITAVSGEYIFPLPSGGFGLDYPLGKNVKISSELNVMCNIQFIPAYLAPGVQVNFQDNQMFVGGGILVLTDFHEHYYGGNSTLLWKFNAGGYINERTKLSVYLLTNKKITGEILIGATVSFKLGKTR
jgi:hypothetical protein